MKAKGQFISFEGIDGAGKSTHLPFVEACLRTQLAAYGVHLRVSREPGGTPLGETLRTLLLHETMCVETEALLMFASRSEHLSQLIRPALVQGDWVLCDRFTDASFAYQGGGKKLGYEKIDALEHWLHADLTPDLTFLFDLPPEVARARRANCRTPDKFEQESETFYETVRAAYLLRVERQPQRFCVIDSSQSIASIQQQLAERLHAFVAAFREGAAA